MNGTLKTILFRLSLIFLTVAIALFSPLSNLAAKADSQTIAQDFNGAKTALSVLKGPVDPKEVETFIDAFLTTHIAHDLPGAVFTLVKDEKILFSKGYGYADLEKKVPMHPDQTLFRVGSLSKLLTATAVMQLVEQGKIKLDEDVTHYLGSLPTKDNGFKRVTTHHLLTHTDGFDVAWSLDSATQCQAKLPDLEQFLAREFPPRVFQPGQLFMYGDAGFALAGRLIEVATGMPFEHYLNQYLFKPLEMAHSTFQQPLPDTLAKRLAVGYRYADGQFYPTKFLCNKSIPSIAMTASATDMAHFMIAHLQQGRYGNTQLLQPETMDIMHRRQYSNFPDHLGLPGSTYGFYERYSEGQQALEQQILEHGGSMYGYINQILLLPDQKTGFFFAYNTNNLEDSIRDELITSFLKHYYPSDRPKPSSLTYPSNSAFQRPSAEFKQVANQITGRYRHIRYPRYSLAKLGMTLSPRTGHQIIAHPNGTITMFLKKSPEEKAVPTVWEEVEPLVFQYPGSKNYVTFKQNAQGKILASCLSNFVFLVYEKVIWYESGPWQIGFALCLAVVFLAAVIVWLLLALSYFQGRVAIAPSSRLTVSLAGVIGFLHLIFPVGILLAMKQIHYWEFALGVPAIVVALLYLPIVAVGLTPVLSGLALWSWADKRWSMSSKLQTLVIILAAWLVIPLLQHWNALGFQFS